MTDTTHGAALDALSALLVEARRQGHDDGDTAAAAVVAALAVWAHVHGPNAARLSADLRRAFARAEAARIDDLDARLIGEARGTA